MVIRDRQQVAGIRQYLLDRLKEEHAFWSYAQESVSLKAIDDESLIAFTMRHLDIDDIKLLFRIFAVRKIKLAWQRLLVPEGEYLYTLNRFFAWYYFRAKRPDAYLKSLITRHFNSVVY